MTKLEEMKEQSEQPSLAAKQAYINALEYRIKELEAEVKELNNHLLDEENQRFLRDEVIKELEEGIKKHHQKKLEIREFFKNISANHPLVGQIPDNVDIELYKLIEKGA